MISFMAFVVGEQTSEIQKRTLRAVTRNLKIKDVEDVDVLRRPGDIWNSHYVRSIFCTLSVYFDIELQKDTLLDSLQFSLSSSRSIIIAKVLPKGKNMETKSRMDLNFINHINMTWHKLGRTVYSVFLKNKYLSNDCGYSETVSEYLFRQIK